jgi:hypothetical protein
VATVVVGEIGRSAVYRRYSSGFVKGLGDVKECSGAVCFVFEGFVNPVNGAMRLVDGGVSPPEAELVSGY